MDGETIYLRCHCKPKPCHGDVIQKLIRKRVAKELKRKEKYNFSNDGVTHINVYSKGKTDIGNFLSNFTYAPFKHPTYGKINSIEGLWYYLKTGEKHKHLLKLDGYTAKLEGQKFDKEFLLNPNTDIVFQFRILEAVKLKIESNKEMKRKFIESTLPFVHYVKKEKIICEWLMKGLEEYRHELKSSKKKVHPMFETEI